MHGDLGLRGAHSSTVHGVDLATRADRWTQQLAGTAEFLFFANREVWAILEPQHLIVAADPATGEPLWAAQLVPDPSHSPDCNTVAATAGGHALVVSSHGGLTAFR